MVRAGIVVDPTRGRFAGREDVHRTIVHEILHALGREHPIDLFRRDTIMSYNHADLPVILYPLDRDAMLVIYDRLEVGSDSSDIH